MATSVAVDPIGIAGSALNRQALGRLLSVLAGHATGAQVRSGVINAGGDPLKVSMAGGRQVAVAAGSALLASTASLGPLGFVSPAVATLECPVADGTNPRRDLVIAEIADDGVIPKTTLAASASAGVSSLSLTAPGVGEPALTTGFYLVGSEVVLVTALSGTGPFTATLADPTTAAHTSGDVIAEVAAQLRIVEGIPAPSPVAPTTNWLDPSNPVGRTLGSGGAWMKLGSCLVPASAGAGSVTSVADLREFTAGAGGLVPVVDLAATSTLPTGTPFFTLDVERFGVKTAAGYQLLRADVAGTGVLAGALPATPMPYSYQDARTIAANGTGKTAVTWPTFNAIQNVRADVGYAGSIGANPITVLCADITTSGCNLVFVNAAGTIVTSGSYVVSLQVSGA